jgi:hypothetical protein
MRRFCSFAAGFLCVVGLGSASASAAGLPDLEQVAPYDIRVEHRDDRWYLGFATAVRNVGTSALRLRGRGSGDGTMTAQQLSEDGQEVLQPNAGEFHYVTTFGHRHWHYMGFMRYELRGMDVAGALLDHKQGFCLSEADFVDGWCARGKPAITGTDLGLESGATDTYHPNVEGQEIEIDPDTTPSGRYLLTSRIGPTGVVQETRTDNNVASTVIRLKWPLGGTQAIAPVNSCVGEGCAGPLPALRRAPRWLSTTIARRLARKALRRTIGRMPSRARIRCRRARPRGNLCHTGFERGRRSYRGTVRLTYKPAGAATRWRYTVRLVRRCAGTKGCTRRIRRIDRPGGTLPTGVRSLAATARGAGGQRLLCQIAS